MRHKTRMPSSGIPHTPRSQLLGRTPLVALLFSVGIFAAGCDSSKPDVPRNPIARHYSRLEGTRMLERAVEAHGGYKIWKHKKDVTFEIADRWRGLAGRWIRPWPEEQAIGRFQAIMDPGYGVVRIQGEPDSLTFGFGPIGAWAMVGKQMAQERKDIETAAAVVPSYLFFFQMPFSFLEYGAVHHYLGVRPAPPGGPVHEVLVTYPWQSGELSLDWFLARFDTSTFLLRSVTYTASRWGPTIIEYTDTVGGYAEIDSLMIPTRHTVRMTRPFRPSLHRWQIRNVEFNHGLTDSLFLGPGGLFDL